MVAAPPVDPGGVIQMGTTVLRDAPKPDLRHSSLDAGGIPGQHRSHPFDGRRPMHKLLVHAHLSALDLGDRLRRCLASERGQGTVEYVGLILLVSLLMVGMVAAMKGFNGKQGTELADVIVDKIKAAVDAITFK
jgi:hypothetical protein